MAWSTYKTILAGILEDNNYREIPENKTPETAASSHEHQSYMLRPIGIGEVVEYTSNGVGYSHKVLLEVKYKNINSNERDLNFQSMLNLFEAIATTADYKGTLSGLEFADLDEKHTKGSFTFLYGQEIECNI